MAAKSTERPVGVSKAIGVGFHLLVKRHLEMIMISPLCKSRTFFCAKLSEQQAISRKNKQFHLTQDVAFTCTS